MTAPLAPRSPRARPQPCLGASAETAEHGPWAALYGGALRRCARCGLVATDCTPGYTYDEQYFTGRGEGGYAFDSPFARALDAARFGAELDRLERQGLRGRLLDIGCATGRFLAHARERGWEIAGVEIADFARQRAENDLGVSIAPSLEALPPRETFDVVTLHHVLEHVHDPLAFLRDVVERRVERRLLIEVPNFASLASRTHGPRWRDLRPEQHVFHYTPATLRGLVEWAGLRVVRVYTLWESLWTLRTALDTVRLLPGVMRPRNDSRPLAAGPPAAVRDVSGFKPPRGVKRSATALSRLAFAPLVAALEAGGLGERLVLEAAPVRRPGRGRPLPRRGGKGIEGLRGEIR
ncbi:MAG TPA: class I SAM-dependent methyltransferase [Thermoanaerobaculia bacterium]|nr:class I SAM-dependent methyltransferase [Thermoanaerobaculia bacterium]